MKTAGILLAIAVLASTGCSVDASRPTQPASATVVTHESQGYCCASCQFSEGVGTCEQCARDNSGNCAVEAQRLFCVSNRIEEQESPGRYRVTCF